MANRYTAAPILNDLAQRAGLHAIGNAIVPQIAEAIGRMIVAVEQGT